MATTFLDFAKINFDYRFRFPISNSNLQFAVAYKSAKYVEKFAESVETALQVNPQVFRQKLVKKLEEGESTRKSASFSPKTCKYT